MSMAFWIRDKFVKIKKFLIKNEDKIILTIGVILIAAISFGAGRLSLEFKGAEPIVIEDGQINFLKQISNNTKNSQKEKNSTVLGEQVKNYKTESQIEPEKLGKFVGSAKSNKYHFPDCKYAKKIKDENKIWFDSVKNAESQGYIAAKCCNPH